MVLHVDITVKEWRACEDSGGFGYNWVCMLGKLGILLHVVM